MSWICAHNSPAKFGRKIFAGSAAGTFVMPKLVNSPVTASAMRMTPDQPGSAENALHSQPPATVPAMMARKGPSSMMPLPHDSFFFRQQFRQQSVFGRAENGAVNAHQKHAGNRDVNVIHREAD